MGKEFFNVQPVSAALESLFQRWQVQPAIETIDCRRALGRVLAESPLSPIDLPTFRRSTVDGYAVRTADTFGASQSLPAYLKCIGSIAMGEPVSNDIQPGQTMLIHTGGMLPASAEAVVMVERTQALGVNEIEVMAPVAPGENVVQIGEDVTSGQALLPVGHRLRPQDIGGLLAVGILEVRVARPPHVAILSTGDELVAPESTPTPGQIRDINAYTLALLIEQAGGEAVHLGISRDELSEFQSRAEAGLRECDILVISAGSSVSTRDLTSEVINSLGEPGILQHGVAVKPGKPTIIALADDKPVIGLPGNPVSALLVARQIVLPLVKQMLGEQPVPPAAIRARLASNIASVTGREDTVPVQVVQEAGSDTWLARPVFGKSNLIYTLVNANGLVTIPLNSTGLKAGTVVDVSLF